MQDRKLGMGGERIDMIIDAHAHVGKGRFKSLAPEELLRQMDEYGVDRAVICPVEEQITVYNQEGNDFILDQVRLFPTRFVGFAVANPWYGQPAVKELVRALGEGLRGLKLHPTVQGFSMNDPMVYPLIDVVARSEVPVYVHTGSAHFGEPLKLVELARRYPEVAFIMGHSGSSDFWSDLGRSHRFAPNIMFETSRNGPSKYTNMALNLGIDYLLFGSNAPESLYSLELASIRDIFTEREDLDKILGLNMARLLGESE
jgi:predicted TIM-barrel fold metal-dependent hydrolase